MVLILFSQLNFPRCSERITHRTVRTAIERCPIRHYPNGVYCASKYQVDLSPTIPFSVRVVGHWFSGMPCHSGAPTKSPLNKWGVEKNWNCHTFIL